MRLRPHDNAAQSILSWDVVLEGATQQTQFTDQHGNLVDLLELEPGRSDVKVTVSGEVARWSRWAVPSAGTRSTR